MKSQKDTRRETRDARYEAHEALRTTHDARRTTLIDTHAHLTFPDYDRDRPDVIRRAWDAGLEQMVLVGAGMGFEGNARALDLAKSDDRFFAMVGVHPHDAEKMEDSWIASLEEMARDEKVVAIGEVGLDYHYEHAKPDIQKACFRDMIALATRADKPIVIHDREAHADVWRIIEEAGMPPRGGLFHCFSGDLAFAERVVEAGFFISIPGVITFKNAKVLREVVANIPLEKMVIETDCPFLAPEPYRGSRNEPAYVAEVARRIAEIKQITFEDVATITTLNAKRVFDLPGSEVEPHIAYTMGNSMYLNITNRCNIACRFCMKFSKEGTSGHFRDYFLKLAREPDVEQIFQAMGQPDKYEEVVFCGYGEPTMRLEVLKVIAKRMKDSGAKRVRLNTNGLANLEYGRDVLLELKGIIDSVSVSLNAPDAATYARSCPSKYGEAAYAAICSFIREAKGQIPEVVATVVDLPGLDIEACRNRAKELGVPLRVRDYIDRP